MENKSSVIMSIIFYYVLVVFGGLFNLIFGILGDNIIGNTSIALFYLLYIILPIFLFLFPIFLYIKFRKLPKKFTQYSYFTLITFIIIFFSIILGLKIYFNKFSKEKWLNFNSNRYCMINDIEKNYNIVGKNKDEIIELLGDKFTENIDDSIIMYDIKYSLVAVQYYILHYENNIIVKTETSWID